MLLWYLTFESVDEILKCDQITIIEQYFPVLFFIEPLLRLFQLLRAWMKLLSETFGPFYLFVACCIGFVFWLENEEKG